MACKPTRHERNGTAWQIYTYVPRAPSELTLLNDVLVEHFDYHPGDSTVATTTTARRRAGNIFRYGYSISVPCTSWSSRHRVNISWAYLARTLDYGLFQNYLLNRASSTSTGPANDSTTLGVHSDVLAPEGDSDDLRLRACTLTVSRLRNRRALPSYSEKY